MEFGLEGTSRVCRGRDWEVGIVEFGLGYTQLMMTAAAGRVQRMRRRVAGSQSLMT